MIKLETYGTLRFWPSLGSELSEPPWFINANCFLTQDGDTDEIQLCINLGTKNERAGADEARHILKEIEAWRSISQ